MTQTPEETIAELIGLLNDAIATIEAEDDPDNDAWLGQAKSAIVEATS